MASPSEIGILVYPGAQQAAVLGLTDLFAVAERLGRAHLGSNGPLLRLSHWREGADGHVFRCFDTGPDGGGWPDAIILPPSLDNAPAWEKETACLDFLAARHAGGCLLASVCAGAFLLAATGLLDGRRATTHWNLAAALARRHPAILVDAGKLVVDEGDIITAGGVMAWTDLGLTLVERLLGPGVMMETARLLLIDPPGRDQRSYSVFVPVLAHGDEAILKVQHWLRQNATRKVTIPALAARAGLGERTFLRRFRKATGLSPLGYCQALRVETARTLLETTKRPVDDIAAAAGYDDPASFRKLFLGLTGLSPAAYRARFGLAGSRGRRGPESDRLDL